MKPIACKKCKQYPTVIRVDRLFYVRCIGHYTTKKGDVKKCNKWLPYEFLGSTKESAIEQWNQANSPGRVRKRL